MSKRFLLPVYPLMVLVMFILPFYTAEGYSLLKHTTSQLGAQSTPHAWVMNGVFFLLGGACILEGWVHLKNFRFQQILLTTFGASLFLAGVFRHAPLNPGVSFNVLEDQLHSVMANIVGFSFTLLAVSAAFIEKTTGRRILALLVGASSVIFSLLMFFMTGLTGLWQRSMFILSFAWLIFFLEGQSLREG